MQIKVINIILIFTLMAYTSIGQAMTISCSLKLLPKRIKPTGIWLKYSLSNDSQTVIDILPWYTPLEGIKTDLFTIQDSNNNEVNYLGVMIKRGKPNLQDFIELVPNQVLSAEIDISSAYHLLSGSYQVNLKPKMLLTKYGDKQKYLMPCNLDNIEIIVK